MYRRIFATLVVLGTFTLIGGCSGDGGKPKTHFRKGIAESVDVNTRTVSMLTEDKRGKETSLTGTYTDETVVQINGRNMSIKDIKPGDPIEVHGYQKDGGQLVATKVIVTRTTKDWKSTGKGGSDTETNDGESSEG